MNRLYKLHLQYIIVASVFSVLTFLLIPAFGQKGPAVHEGLVRLKVSEALAATLERSPMSRTADGVVVTGVSSLDEFNRQYNVKRFRRLFRVSGKFEARHRRHGLHRWYEISIESPVPVLQAVSAYQSLIQVEKAEPVHKKAIVGSEHADFGPVVVAETALSSAAALNGPSNDPMLAGQWHYNNTGQTGGTPGADIRLFEAWQRETGKQEVIVAVTDGGIQTDHPDLVANLWINSGEIPGNGMDDDDNGFADDVHGYSFADDTGEVVADDHGTHVAGTIAAVTHNGIGVAGVAGGSGGGNGVRLMSCAVFSDFSADGFPESYVYAADNGAIISQNSWGYLDPGVYELAVLDAIDYFIAEAGKDETGVQRGPMKGGLVIFAAGNSNSEEKYYPGYYAPTFAVAGTTHKNGKAWYSNYGTWVDIAAPGGETEYVEAEGVLSTLTGGRYGLYQGTSMACPHVSGVAALVISKYGKPGFTPEAVRERLLSTSATLDTGNPAYSGKMGRGRLDAGAALRDNDHIAPAAITDLSIAASDIGTETLSWTVPADEDGFVASYDIRYSKEPVTATNFSAATAVADPPAAGPAGSQQRFTVTGLSGGTLYYFAIRAIDFEGNISPISNVVSKTTELAPVIAITPASVTENLQTARTSTRTFTVRNTGPGPLRFQLANAVTENDFAACDPRQGNLAPGASQVVTVTFDANHLLGGTYRKDLRVESNDPERSLLIVPLILVVTNNNAPIASVRPDSIHFKSVQTGMSARRPIILHNAGSDPLVISRVVSGNTDFTTDFPGSLSIPAFQDDTITVIFSPASPGLKHTTIAIRTNDEAHATLAVAVQGEGLNEAPVAAMPASIAETLGKGTTSRRTLVLKNNGSFDRTFSLEVVSKGPRADTTAHDPDAISSPGASAARARSSQEHYQARPAPDPADVDGLLLSMPMPAGFSGARQKGAARQRKNAGTLAVEGKYATGFENFDVAPVNDQEGWYSTEGWNVSVDNPARGEKHLRGTAVVPGQTTLAISPALYPDDMPEEYPALSMTSMRVNFDNAEGASWQIVPQDYWSYVVTRIRINPDRTIDVMSTDENYEILWNRIEAEIPSGYFDLAVEHNGHGDGTSGFPVFHLYLNHKKVFTGYNIGPSINQVAFICTADHAGPALDVDQLEFREGEYVPAHITPSPVTGDLPAGSAVEIDLDIDGTDMRFGTYHSDIVARIDDTEQIVVPAVVTITGAGSARATPGTVIGDGYRDEPITMNLQIENTGGAPFDYQLRFDLPSLSVSASSGTIPMRGSEGIVLSYDPSVAGPGIFYDTLEIVTTLQERPVLKVPLSIRVWEELADFSAPNEVYVLVKPGETATHTFQVSNLGDNTISFETHLYDNSQISIAPATGTVSAGEPQDIIVTIDASQMTEGSGSREGYFITNDPHHIYHPFRVNFDVLQPCEGAGAIQREVWAGVPGTTVSAIPVNLPPSSISALAAFESPSNAGDHYGSRIRGYVCVPVTGNYTFWIASDDHSELWLSTDEDPANKVKIASVTGHTRRRQWDKYPTQVSAVIALRRGHRYYIEALHKEGTGTDHLAVGWQLPDGTLERPIGGNRLIRFSDNFAPTVSIISPSDRQEFSTGETITITADAADVDGSVTKVEFYQGESLLREDNQPPYSFHWSHAGAGRYVITAKAFDDLGASASASVNIEVTGTCAGTGTLYWDFWPAIAGTSVSSIPVNTPPGMVTEITSFETPPYFDNNYGARLRGYICVPQTGSYTFWIASDDNSELWLSTDTDRAHKVKIASVPGSTRPRQWDKYPTQRSVAINLVAGYRYYIEALHKEANGNDHVAVGWQLPDGTFEGPIPGSRLSPRPDGVASARTGENNVSFAAADDSGANNEISLFPNPAAQGFVTLSVSGDADQGTMNGAQVSITSITGTVVYAEVVSCEGCSSMKIAVERLTPGVYMVHAVINRKRFSQKLVVR